MKVTVTKYLNVRVGKASVNAPCYEYLSPGHELEVDDKIHQGDHFEGSNGWLKDAAGNYYWAGAVEEKNLNAQIVKNNQNSWWLQNYGIKEVWSKGYTGRGIKVAVLDTGVSYPHPDLALDPELFYDATAGPSNVKDNFGHGTHCAGIIKASNNEFGATGLAFNSSLYVCKVTHDTLGDKPEYLTTGIKWALKQNVDIISISKGDPFFDDADLKQALDNADKQGILVVCAAGNKMPGYPDDHIYYPARYSTTLSVGGIQEDRSPLLDSILTKETLIFAPGFQIFSTYKDSGYMNLSGSSQAAPFIAGLSALLLEFKRKSDPLCKANSLKDILQASADVTDFGKIINSQKLFI